MTDYTALIAELRGFAEGSTSARATLMRDAADAIEGLLGEWDYGCANFGDLDDVMTVPGPLALQGKTEREWAEGVLQPEYGDFLARRRKSGPWERVE